MHVLNSLQLVITAHFVIFATASRGAALPLGGVVQLETHVPSVIFAPLPSLAGMQETARVQRALQPSSSSFGVASAAPPGAPVPAAAGSPPAAGGVASPGFTMPGF